MKFPFFIEKCDFFNIIYLLKTRTFIRDETHLYEISSFLTQVSEDDFESIEQLGFTKDHTQILWQFVTSKRESTQNILDEVSIVEYRFRDLDWRLEGRVASRSLHHQSTPFITIKFHLDCDSVNENKSSTKAIVAKLDGDSISSRRRRQVIFQTDPNNLLYIIGVLEKTLNESRAHRVRNIVKSL